MHEGRMTNQLFLLAAYIKMEEFSTCSQIHFHKLILEFGNTGGFCEKGEDGSSKYVHIGLYT